MRETSPEGACGGGDGRTAGDQYDAYAYDAYASDAYAYDVYADAAGAATSTDHPNGTVSRGRRSHHAKPRRRRHRSSSSGVRTMQGKDSAAEVLKPSLADMAAVSIEMWSGLEHTGSSADVSLETAKEAAALRFLLLEERKRVKKELRPLKHAWETAERRASGLEHELLLVRCTQSLLSKEIGEADALSSWWRGQYTAARRDVEEQRTAVQGCNARLESLHQELERANLQIRELSTALALHDSGRDHLHRRLLEREAQLEAHGAKAEQQLQLIEERRTAELCAHEQRIHSVSERLEHFVEQIGRQRLDVDEWTTVDGTCERLKAYLHDEVRQAELLRKRRIELYEHELAAERQACGEKLFALEQRLVAVAAERTDLQTAIRRTAVEVDARQAAQHQVDLNALREQLAQCERAVGAKDNWMCERVLALQAAFRGDVHALATTVESLRNEALQANVYARASTRLLREQVH